MLMPMTVCVSASRGFLSLEALSASVNKTRLGFVFMTIWCGHPHVCVSLFLWS